jgi:hypothetical protein
MEKFNRAEGLGYSLFSLLLAVPFVGWAVALFQFVKVGIVLYAHPDNMHLGKKKAPIFIALAGIYSFFCILYGQVFKNDGTYGRFTWWLEHHMSSFNKDSFDSFTYWFCIIAHFVVSYVFFRKFHQDLEKHDGLLSNKN